MSRRRSQLEITLEILESVRNGEEKPTRIMYASNLSWNRSQVVLSDLVDQGLLEMRTASGISNKRYLITEKGVKVLNYFDEGRKLLQTDFPFF